VPIAMLSDALIIDEMPTKISGAEVPNAIMVNPIVISLTPRPFASEDELETNFSALKINITSEIRK
jgi:hypothetical protein|tara:strand:- start:2986 stop:3183 length:198 start_codon:yes stop_codon:yes gene_type:complete